MRKLLALGAFFVIGAGIAGCGSSIPGNSVASVAGNPITLAAYNHWTYIAAKQQAIQAEEEGEASSAATLVPTDPPNFEKCIAQIRKLYPTYKKTAAKTLKVDCATDFQNLRSEIMPYLIVSYWYQAEAQKEGLKIDEAQVTAKVNKEIGADRATALKELAAYGYTIDDLTFQVRANMAYTQLVAKYQKPVTDADIAAYYAANKSSYATKASANLNVVRTKTAANAQAVYAALKSGSSWATVAKKYAVDSSLRSSGGKMTGVTSSSVEADIWSKIAKSPVGQVTAPIHGEFGYYVIEVTKHNAAVQESLAKATPAIRTKLTKAAKSTAASALAKQAEKNWKPKTHCRTLWSVSICKGYNSKASTPASWSASTTTNASTTTTSATTTTGAASSNVQSVTTSATTTTK